MYIALGRLNFIYCHGDHKHLELISRHIYFSNNCRPIGEWVKRKFYLRHTILLKWNQFVKCNTHCSKTPEKIFIWILQYLIIDLHITYSSITCTAHSLCGPMLSYTYDILHIFKYIFILLYNQLALTHNCIFRKCIALCESMWSQYQPVLS